MSNGTVFSTWPGGTDLVLFPLEHISHQELLEKMLKDRYEVAVLSAVLIKLLANGDEPNF